MLVDIVVGQPGWEAGVWKNIRPEIRAAAAKAFETGLRALPNGGLSGIQAEIGIRLTDNDEMTMLNAKWRGRDRPTNVLSFPCFEDRGGAVPPEEGAFVPLGDVVLARQIIEQEAEAADLPPADHLKHLVAHGVLHLLGYDHETDEQADIMEALEVRVLEDLGVSPPYAAPDAPDPVPRRREENAS